LYEARAQLAAIEPSLVTAIEALYRKIEDKMDPFLSQSAPREVLLLFQDSLLVASLFLPLCAYARRQLRAPAC
jgi:hypothetical protein